MNLKHSMKLLLIALFVLASQNTTIHFQHHELDKISECNICDTFHNMNLYQHNTPVVVINENLAIETRREAEKVVVNSRFDYTDTPLFKQIDIVKKPQYNDRSVTLGFNATAPPVYFS